MARTVVAPPALGPAAAASGFSAAVRAGELLFLTGMTGGDRDGQMPEAAAGQVRNALAKADEILAAAGGTLADVVEMTSYHVGLREHWGVVEPVLRGALGMPLPAWTAVEMAGLL